MDFRILCVLLFAIWSGEKIVRTEGEWLEILGPERYNVMRKKGTEKAFTYPKNKALLGKGNFLCAACGLELFKEEDQFDVGNGWPNFKQPVHSKHVYYLEDWNLIFKRYEVLCRQCDCHLGHVFHDGPAPKHLRYCINSITLVRE